MNKDSISGLTWISNPYSTNIKQIDYVFLYGITLKIDDVTMVDLKNTLRLNYNLIYTSSNKYISLYKKESVTSDKSIKIFLQKKTLLN